jgi:hypothetical protein
LSVGDVVLSLGDWLPVFEDGIVSSSSRVKMSMRKFLFVDILTLEDETARHM